MDGAAIKWNFPLSNISFICNGPNYMFCICLRGGGVDVRLTVSVGWKSVVGKFRIEFENRNSTRAHLGRVYSWRGQTFNFIPITPVWSTLSFNLFALHDFRSRGSFLHHLQPLSWSSFFSDNSNISWGTCYTTNKIRRWDTFRDWFTRFGEFNQNSLFVLISTFDFVSNIAVLEAPLRIHDFCWASVLLIAPSTQ